MGPLSMIMLAALLAAQPAEKPARSKPAPGAKHPATLVAYPHPLITEVLVAVPDGAAGDANGDGKRSATGDEFVELVNPHSKSISLKGYVLTDTPREQGKNGPAKGGRGGGAVSYEFGDVVLAPGQVAVVFNGYSGPDDEAVGSPPSAPARETDDGDGKREGEGSAGRGRGAQKASKRPRPPIVLSIKPRSLYAAFNNEGDCVVLLDPRGLAVQAVSWGEHGEASASDVEKAAPLREHAEGAGTRGAGSIARRGLTKGLIDHAEVPVHAGAPFSPGVFNPDPDARPAGAGAAPSTPANDDPPPKLPDKPVDAPAEEDEATEPATPTRPEPAGPYPAPPKPE